MGYLLSSNIGNMMKRYIGDVGRDRGIREVNTIEEIAERRFFNWDIDAVTKYNKCQEQCINNIMKHSKQSKI
jgi:hypothetical protein